MKEHMSYFKKKVHELRNEYVEADAKEFIKSKGGKCELCGRKEKDEAVFGPTHYIRRRINFKVHIHIHKIKNEAGIYKVCVCDLCHLSYHLWNRLEPDAYFGNRTIESVANSKSFTYGNPISMSVRKRARK